MEDPKIILKGSGEFSEIFPSEGIEVAQIRHGKWVKDPHSQNGFPSHIYMMWKCSACGHSADNQSPYCPNCGARMDAQKGKKND